MNKFGFFRKFQGFAEGLGLWGLNVFRFSQLSKLEVGLRVAMWKVESDSSLVIDFFYVRIQLIALRLSSDKAKR
jgi:hypothetical protein